MERASRGMEFDFGAAEINMPFLSLEELADLPESPQQLRRTVQRLVLLRDFDLLSPEMLSALQHKMSVREVALLSQLVIEGPKEVAELLAKRTALEPSLCRDYVGRLGKEFFEISAWEQLISFLLAEKRATSVQCERASDNLERSERVARGTLESELGATLLASLVVSESELDTMVPLPPEYSHPAVITFRREYFKEYLISHPRLCLAYQTTGEPFRKIRECLRLINELRDARGQEGVDFFCKVLREHFLDHMRSLRGSTLKSFEVFSWESHSLFHRSVLAPFEQILEPFKRFSPQSLRYAWQIAGEEGPLSDCVVRAAAAKEKFICGPAEERFLTAFLADAPCAEARVALLEGLIDDRAAFDFYLHLRSGIVSGKSARLFFDHFGKQEVFARASEQAGRADTRNVIGYIVSHVELFIENPDIMAAFIELNEDYRFLPDVIKDYIKHLSSNDPVKAALCAAVAVAKPERKALQSLLGAIRKLSAAEAEELIHSEDPVLIAQAISESVADAPLGERFSAGPARRRMRLDMRERLLSEIGAREEGGARQEIVTRLIANFPDHILRYAMGVARSAPAALVAFLEDAATLQNEKAFLALLGDRSLLRSYLERLERRDIMVRLQLRLRLAQPQENDFRFVRNLLSPYTAPPLVMGLHDGFFDHTSAELFPAVYVVQSVPANEYRHGELPVQVITESALRDLARRSALPIGGLVLFLDTPSDFLRGAVHGTAEGGAVKMAVCAPDAVGEVLDVLDRACVAWREGRALQRPPE